MSALLVHTIVILILALIYLPNTQRTDIVKFELDFRETDTLSASNTLESFSVNSVSDLQLLSPAELKMEWAIPLSDFGQDLHVNRGSVTVARGCFLQSFYLYGGKRDEHYGLPKFEGFLSPSKSVNDQALETRGNASLDGKGVGIGEGRVNRLAEEIRSKVKLGDLLLIWINCNDSNEKHDRFLTLFNHEKLHRSITLEHETNALEVGDTPSQVVSCLVDVRKRVVGIQRFGSFYLEGAAFRFTDTMIRPNYIESALMQSFAMFGHHYGDRDLYMKKINTEQSIVILVRDRKSETDSERIARHWNASGMSVHLIDLD